MRLLLVATCFRSGIVCPPTFSASLFQGVVLLALQTLAYSSNDVVLAIHVVVFSAVKPRGHPLVCGGIPYLATHQSA